MRPEETLAGTKWGMDGMGTKWERIDEHEFRINLNGKL